MAQPARAGWKLSPPGPHVVMRDEGETEDEHPIATRQSTERGRYARLARMIATDQCVILDGAIGTELIKVGRSAPRGRRARLGPDGARSTRPRRSQALHRTLHRRRLRRHLHQHLGPADRAARRRRRSSAASRSRSTGWTSPAAPCASRATPRRTPAGERRGGGRVQHQRRRRHARRPRDDPPARRARSRSEPPDLILLETLSLVRSSTYATVEALLDTGLPVWLSFRRCRQGVCGVYGEHWGGPEGDAFGRAARRFEEMGVGALAINCIPPDHVAGMLSWLRDFTDLPLGVYPNLGYLSVAGWRQEPGVAGHEYAELALNWRGEGAQIIGGCCGVRPEHLAAARAALSDTKPGHERPAAAIPGRPWLAGSRTRRRAPWQDAPRPRPVPARRARRSRSSPACSCRRRAASWPGSTSTARASAPTSAASTSAAGQGLLAVAAGAQRRGARARDRYRRSSRSRTRSPTRFATASPIASRRRPRTSTRGCPRSATT